MANVAFIFLSLKCSGYDLLFHALILLDISRHWLAYFWNVRVKRSR